MMNRQPECPADHVLTSLLGSGVLALLILLASLAGPAMAESQPDVSAVSSPIHVTHVLGFEDARRNVSGDLTIDDGKLIFQRNGSPPAKVSVNSIQNISLGEQDKQVGGVPMMLGKAAIPYGGGRMVSLFSHKKYDNVAIEYLDQNGGFHGVVFRLAKGQGDILNHALIAHGVDIPRPQVPAAVQEIPEKTLDAQKWSVEVERINPGATTLDLCFANAIYENLLRQLPKSKTFQNVFRSGDRNAKDEAGVLLLKTHVEQFSQGSETRRAVTTVTGATKLKVHIQLVTRDGRMVLERTIDGNVRFMGENLGATNKIAKKTATILQNSSLPKPGAPIPQQTTSNQPTASL